MLKKLLPASVKKGLKYLIKKVKFYANIRKVSHYSVEDLVYQFRDLGIKDGDVLFIHSSLKSMGYIEGGAQTVIDALLQSIGVNGTLVFPTFTIYNTMLDTVLLKERIYDPIKDEVTTGKIPNTFRKMPNVRRSIHATHSVAAIGKYANHIIERHHLQETNFGKGTPFEKMIELGVKIVGLGINFGPVTYYHAFEDKHLELFSGVYVEKRFPVRLMQNGKIIEANQLSHDPTYSKGRIDKNPEVENFFNAYLNEAGIVNRGKVGDADSWWMNAEDLMKQLDILYKQGKTIYKV